MIEVKNISKSFDEIKAIDEISTNIQEQAVYGLIGTNGAGKSTFLRMLCGIMKPDEGEIFIDGTSVYENEEAKKSVFYISDEQYFFPNSTPKEMIEYYSAIYEDFNQDRAYTLLEKFGLGRDRKINTFSKGMKKQLSVILGICAMTKYLLCDETFDGLDPAMRQAVKSMFIAEIEDRGMTPIIASHNLRELEDICDHIGLLHKGGVLFTKDLDELKCNIHKVQCVFRDEESKVEFMEEQKPVKTEQRGSLYTMTFHGQKEEIERALIAKNPIFFEILPLSLEEIFICETEVVGYDIKSLIL